MPVEKTTETKAEEAEIVELAQEAKSRERGQEIPLQSLATPIAIVVAGVLIAGAVLYTSAHQTTQLAQMNAQQAAQQAQQGAAPAAPAVDINAITTAGEPFIGNPDAKVVIAYWYDYQCPFCQRHEQQVMPQMIKDYVDTGKARIVFKDYAFLGPDSVTAALASHAVWEVAPDKFFAWHKMMFDNQGPEHGGWAKKENVLKLTKTIPGIDVAKVEALMTSKAAEYQQGMDADQAEGQMIGVTGTPAFAMGHQLVMGAQPYPTIKAAIDTTLNALNVQ